MVFFNKLEKCPIVDGITVSKSELSRSAKLQITEYVWGHISLWFVDDDKFTENERQGCFEAFMTDQKMRQQIGSKRGRRRQVESTHKIFDAEGDSRIVK